MWVLGFLHGTFGVYWKIQKMPFYHVIGKETRGKKSPLNFTTLHNQGGILRQLHKFTGRAHLKKIKKKAQNMLPFLFVLGQISIS